jgi:AcrR family transcriptional regulator
MQKERAVERRGRPRAFNIDDAIQRAMHVFWKKGYEGASMSELTEAMGINAPSLYAAFGSKEGLFRKVLERYGEGPAAYVMESLNAPTARAVAELRLYGAVEVMTDSKHPWGCMAVQAAVACGESADPIREELISARFGTQEALRRRLERAKAEGDLPADSDPAELASYISTLVNGISVQAASGVSRDELRRVVRTALRAWPD